VHDLLHQRHGLRALRHAASTDLFVSPLLKGRPDQLDELSGLMRRRSKSSDVALIEGSLHLGLGSDARLSSLFSAIRPHGCQRKQQLCSAAANAAARAFSAGGDITARHLEVGAVWRGDPGLGAFVIVCRGEVRVAWLHAVRRSRVEGRSLPSPQLWIRCVRRWEAGAPRITWGGTPRRGSTPVCHAVIPLRSSCAWRTRPAGGLIEFCDRLLAQAPRVPAGLAGEPSRRL